MLRRNSSRSKSGLSRSKSTASMRSAVEELEHINPAVAIRDAHVAANLSFARARDRTTAKFGNPIPDSPRNSESSRENTIERSEFGDLGRQRSVRFIKPTTGHRRSLATLSGSQSGSLRLAALNDENRPLSQSSSVGRVPSTLPRDRDDGYLHVLQASEEYYTPEDNIASAPSSYRRLRKSKSTVAQSVPYSNYSFNNGSPRRQGFRTHTLRNSIFSDKANTRPSSEVLSLSLRAPKSMSSLIRSRQPLSRQTIQRENDRAVEMAREMFRETAEQQQRLKSYPSRFFRSKNKRSDGPADPGKSLRGGSSSINSAGFPFSLPSNDIPAPKGSLKTKARRVSNSLKTKLKKLLHISRKDELGTGTGLPHEDRSPSARGDDDAFGAEGDAEGDPDTLYEVDEPPYANQCSMARVLSGVPSIHNIPSEDQLFSRKGSLESLKSERKTSEDKSRVTSWTSSGVDTVANHTVEWEKQCISAANEKGSIRRVDPVAPMAQTRLPTNADTILSSGPLEGPGPIVHSERVYSALMKREKHKGSGNLELQQRGAQNLGLAGRQTPTIRFVGPGDDVFVDNFTTSALSTLQSGCTIKDNRSRTPSTGSIVRRHPSNLTASQNSYKPYSLHTARDGFGNGLSPSKSLASLVSDNGRASGPPSTRTSAFLASPDQHLFRGSSPYRRALQDKMKAPQDSDEATPSEFNYLPSMSDIDLPTRCPSTKPSETDPPIHYASSVYSSAASSAEQMQKNAEGLTDDYSAPQTVPGSATISADPLTYQPKHSIDRVVSDESNTSSVEWKTWLSANVSKLKRPQSVGDTPENVRYAMLSMPKSFGHIREAAEIESSSGIGSPVTYKPTGLATDGSTPSTPLQPVEANTLTSRSPKEQDPCTFSLPHGAVGSKPPTPIHRKGENVAPALMEDSSDSRASSSRSLPRIPPRNPLRLVPSLPTLRAPARASPSEAPGGGNDGSKALPKVRSLSNTPNRAKENKENTKTHAIKLTRRPHGLGATVISPSQGLAAVAEKRRFSVRPNVQFSTGSPMRRTEKARAGLEKQVSPGDEEASQGDASEGEGLGPAESQMMGSRRMVDLFLSSRRRKIAGSEDTTAFI